MTATDIDTARLRTLVAELEQMLAPSTAAAANADGTPALVAAGALIESAWGNAVANTFTKHKAIYRAQSLLSLASGSTDTVGRNLGGNVAVPTQSWNQVLRISVSVLVDCAADGDIILQGPTGLMRKCRFRSTSGAPNGVSVAFTTGAVQAAGASGSNFFCQIATVSGAVSSQLLGGNEFNYIDVAAQPAP